MFEYKSPNFEKLSSFGFKFDGEKYSYSVKILGGQFELNIEISSASKDVRTRLTDLSTGEPYTLHLVAGAGGAFVGAVRAEYERVLTEIADKCFENDVFKGDIPHMVIDYVRERYGDELEFLWKTFPSNAVWRRKDNKKWYGILLTVSKRKLGLDSDETAYVIDMRADPETLPSLVDGKRYFRGYHMNKKHWLTICLDGSVPAEEIFVRIDESYDLAKKK